MSSHGSCPGSAPYPRSPPPALSSLRVCPDQTPTLLSTQLTLPLQLFSDPSSHSGSSSRSSDREQTSLPSAPLSLSSSTPTRCPAVLALWGPFSPRLSVHTGPSVPEPGAVHRIQKEGGSCRSLWLLQGALVPSVFPQPQQVPLTINESPHLPPSCECRKAPQPSIFCPRTTAPAMSSSRMFSPENHRAPVSPRLRQQPPPSPPPHPPHFVFL